MAYTVELRPAARREFQRLSLNAQVRLKPHIDALADNPRPPGCQKLRGEDNLWRIRVGEYRVLFQIHDRALVVIIITLGHRREVYR